MKRFYFNISFLRYYFFITSSGTVYCMVEFVKRQLKLKLTSGRKDANFIKNFFGLQHPEKIITKEELIVVRVSLWNRFGIELHVNGSRIKNKLFKTLLMIAVFSLHRATKS